MHENHSGAERSNMTRFPLVSAILVSGAFVGLGAACTQPQPVDDQDIEIVPAASTAETDSAPIVGGYVPGDVSDPAAKAAYDMVHAAIYEQYPTRALVDAVSLETQVVAGLNYRFRVEMTGSPQARGIFEAVIYRDLDGNLSLTRLDKLQ